MQALSRRCAAQGDVVVDCTSGDPTHSAHVATYLKEVGCSYVDCPVSGGPAGAEAGTLTCMVGGDVATVQTVRPFIESFSKKIVHAGPSCSGHALKAVNNTLNVAHLILGTEALLALSKFGVRPDTALVAINSSSGRSLQTEVRLPVEVLSRKFGYGFKLGLMQKDVRIGQAILQQSLPAESLITGVLAIVNKASTAQGADADYTESQDILRIRQGSSWCCMARLCVAMVLCVELCGARRRPRYLQACWPPLGAVNARAGTFTHNMRNGHSVASFHT